MAEDPWGQFVPKANDPWGQFVAPAQGTPAPTPAPSPTATSAPVGPSAPGGQAAPSSGNALWDYLRHPAADQPGAFGPQGPATLSQVAQGADDMVRKATNVVLPGDQFAAYMSGLTGIGGGDLAAQKAATAAADARLPPEARIAATMMGYGPLAAQGIAGSFGGGLVGSMAGSGLEMAAGGALHGAGQSQSPTWSGVASDALTGAETAAPYGVAGGAGSRIVGALADRFAGGAGPRLNATAGDITSDLEAVKTGKYTAFNNLPFAGSDVGEAAAKARAEIEDAYPGGPAGSAMQQAAPRSMAVLKGIEKRLEAGAQDQTLSGQDAANYLVGQRGTMSPSDYGDAWTQLSKTGQVTLHGQLPTVTGADLLTSLDKLRDIQGRTAGAENDIAPIIEQHLNDMLANKAPANGMAPGAGATMLQDARASQAPFANAQGLQKAARALRDFGTSPAGWAQQTADEWHPDPNSAQYQALAKIANAGAAPLGQTSYGLVHGLVHPAVETAAMAAFHPAVAVPVAAAATFLGAKPLINKLMGAGSKVSALDALYRSYPALTGKTFAPPPTPDYAAPLRSLLFGNRLSNQ
jgi:hypothetical protein